MADAKVNENSSKLLDFYTRCYEKLKKFRVNNFMFYAAYEDTKLKVEVPCRIVGGVNVDVIIR